jgi:hypothetical protein
MAMSTAPLGHDGLRLPLSQSQRRRPQLLVAVDGSAPATRRLVWALREAARRDATVLAMGVVEAGADQHTREAARTLLEAQTRHAVEESGVRDRVHTALLDPVVLDALDSAAAGGDLVLVDAEWVAVLRPAVARVRTRRPFTRCG